MKPEDKASSAAKTQRHCDFFVNRECEFFPCHPGADPENFNCLFCYCPLYMLGSDCGGDFYYNEKGYKVCKGCLRPHLRENIPAIRARFADIAARLARDKDRNDL